MAPLELIGTRDAARLLGITRAGLNKRVKQGQINPAGSIGPRKIRVFDRARIEEIVAEQEATATC